VSYGIKTPYRMESEKNHKAQGPTT
jgi:hypothetical protein